MKQEKMSCKFFNIIKTLLTASWLIMCLGFSSDSIAQYNAGENLDRYWFYRNRLNLYYISVGPDSGQSVERTRSIKPTTYNPLIS